MNNSRKDRARKLLAELWYTINKPDADGNYFCHYCQMPLTRKTMTLDHKYTASRYPEYRYDVSNLMPACAFDNHKRGQLEYEIYMRRFYPERIKKFGKHEIILDPGQESKMVRP